MSTRTVNTTLLALVLAQWASGFGSFLAGSPDGQWTVWLHAAGGGAIVVLLLWKGRVIVAFLRRHGVGLWALPSLALLVLLLAVLGTGVLWSSTGLPDVAGSSGLTLHVVLSLAMAAFFGPHVRAMRPQ